MRTPSEIAKRTAENLITIRRQGDWTGLDVGDVSVATLTHYSDVLAEVRSQVASAVERAIEEALSQCPVPGSDLPDRSLGSLRDSIRREVVQDLPRDALVRGLVTCVRHIDFLHRIFTGPEAEAYAEMYRQGRRDGEKTTVAKLLPGM